MKLIAFISLLKGGLAIAAPQSGLASNDTYAVSLHRDQVDISFVAPIATKEIVSAALCTRLSAACEEVKTRNQYGVLTVSFSTSDISAKDALYIVFFDKTDQTVGQHLIQADDIQNSTLNDRWQLLAAAALGGLFTLIVSGLLAAYNDRLSRLRSDKDRKEKRRDEIVREISDICDRLDSVEDVSHQEIHSINRKILQLGVRTPALLAAKSSVDEYLASEPSLRNARLAGKIVDLVDLMNSLMTELVDLKV